MSEVPGRVRAIVAPLLALVIAAAAAADATTLEIGAFSRQAAGGDPPAGWQPLTFPGVARHTVYRLVADGGQTVLRADANASASGLIRRVAVDPNAYPVLVWRWKVAAPVAAAAGTGRQSDDYAARVYVAFEYDPARVSALNRAKYALNRFLYGEYPPHAGLSYVWASGLAPGTVMASPYSDRVRIIVVRSDGADAGRWLDETRNVLADYRRAFGEEPPAISGVAVMTDADDTGTSATAWFGDIVLRRAP